MLLITPFISFVFQLNQSFTFPSWMLEYDRQAELMTIAFLQMDNSIDLIINLFVLAVVPAIGEELLGGLPALNVSSEGNKTQYSVPLQILILMKN